MSLSDRLLITELASTQSNRSVTVNEAIAKLEPGSSLFTAVSLGDNTPPVSPTARDGDVYVLGTAPTGAWAGQGRNIAIFHNDAWFFLPAHYGMMAYAQDEEVYYYFDGTSSPGTWTAMSLTGSSFTAASTTEVLTGTDTAKGVTPDSLAALWEKGSDVASAGTVSLGEGGYFHITGTTTITDIDFATAKDGRHAWLIFDGILTLTHNATTLKLPGNVNITTAAGDRALFVQDASDNVICLAYINALGTAVVPSTTGTIYDFGSAFETAPTAGSVITRVEIGRSITIPANFSGGSAHVATNPAATFDVDVQDDGVSIGTISISTGGVATLTTVSGTSKSVAAGSVVRFIAPANSPAEATVAGFSAIICATVA